MKYLKDNVYQILIKIMKKRQNKVLRNQKSMVINTSRIVVVPNGKER